MVLGRARPAVELLEAAAAGRIPEAGARWACMRGQEAR